MKYPARVCCVLPVQQSSFFCAVPNDTQGQGDDTQFGPWCGSVAAKWRTGRTALHSVEGFVFFFMHTVLVSVSYLDILSLLLFEHTVHIFFLLFLFWVFFQTHYLQYWFFAGTLQLIPFWDIVCFRPDLLSGIHVLFLVFAFFFWGQRSLVPHLSRIFFQLQRMICGFCLLFPPGTPFQMSSLPHP